MSEQLAKWVGIGSGIATLILAVPALASMNAFLLGGVVIALTILGVSLFTYFRADPYDIEFVSQDIELDVQDADAKRVVQTRRTRLRARRNQVETVTDHMSADGGMTMPEVDPGIVKNIRREGGDLFVTAALGRVLRKGQEIDRTLKTVLLNSFQQNSEYWSVRIDHPTQRFTLTVKFPPQRGPRTFRGLHRQSTYEQLADVQPELAQGAGGTSTLRWTVLAPKLKDVYKLEWDW